MHILHVTPYYEDAWAYGGIPRAAAATVRGLAARGHNLTVCTTDACRPDARLDAPAAASAEAGSPQVTVKVFRNLSNRVAYHLQFFTPIGLSTFLRAHAGEFDLAHLHGCHHLPGAIAARHLRAAGTPYVLTPHGTAPYLERRRSAKRLFDVTLGRGVIEGAARVIAVSNAERAQLQRLGSIRSEAIEVVPNPVDLNEFVQTFPGAFRNHLGIPPAAPLVLFLGKMTAQKRLDVLVEAFAKIASPDAYLVIAGNDMGYERTLRTLLVRHAVQARTILPGLLTGAERLCALADADVVVYASVGEVFGLVPVEALLCGTPVIVSNDSGCGEVISETGGGILVPHGDPDALCSALDLMLADRDGWRRTALAARVRAQRYSARLVCAEIETVYRSVTGPSRTRRAAVR
jgi:glycosyltransferase involved in cell wall biosynthesis